MVLIKLHCGRHHINIMTQMLSVNKSKSHNDQGDKHLLSAKHVQKSAGSATGNSMATDRTPSSKSL